MMCGRPPAVLCAAGILFLWFEAASAQQPGVKSGRTDALMSSTSQGKTRTVTLQTPTTIAPRKTPGPQSRPADQTRIVPQGFSVVLVLADLTASRAQDDVPPAARRALADMKDFLPYKSYKLLDAAWVLGQGQQTIRLRGPEEHEYELRLVTPGYATGSGRLSVQFVLREAQGHAASAEAVLQAEASETEHRREMARVAAVLQEAREKRDQARIRELEQDLALLRERRARSQSSLRKGTASRPVIDTSFTMDIGETVVVGTSRLKGNSRALIALLTAVPPRGASSSANR